MKRIIAGCTTVAALLLVGCSTPAAPATDVPAGSNRPATTASEPMPDASEEPTVDTGVVAFGSAYTWADGVSLLIGKPAPYKPTEWASGAEKGSKAVVMTVTLVNKSGAPFDPSMASFSAQSSNEEAQQIFDSSNKVSGAPETKILDGREVKFKIAFSVADVKDIVVEASPSWEHESVMFQS